MVLTCSIVSCNSVFIAGNGITFHKFPSKEVELRKKWTDAIPPGLLKPTKNMLVCSLHFLAENYHNTPTGRNFLKKGSTPTLFGVLQDNNSNKTNETVITSYQENIDPRGKREERVEENTIPEVLHNKVDSSTQTWPKRLKLDPKVKLLRNKVDALQKRLSRRDNKIRTLKTVIQTLEDNAANSQDIRDMLRKNFSNDKLKLLLNEVNNNDVAPNKRQYSEEIEQFALTIYLHSPKAHELLRKYLYLPCPSTLRSWMATYSCESDE